MTNRQPFLKDVILALRAYIIHDYHFLLVIGGLSLGSILASLFTDNSSIAYLVGFWIGMSIGMKLK